MNALKKCKGTFVLNIIFITLDVILEIYFAILLKDLINITLLKDMTILKNMVYKILIYAIIAHIVIYFKKILCSLLLKKINSLNKKFIFESIINFDIQNYSKHNISKYISIFNNDIKMLENDYYLSILSIYSGALSFLTASVVLIGMNIYIYLSVILTSILVFTIPQLLNKKLSSLKKDNLNKLSELINQIKDLLSGFEIIKSFNIENKAIKNFLKYDEQTNNSQYKLNKLNGLLETLSTFLGLLVFLTVILTGSYLATNDKISIGVLMASIQLINNLLNPIQSISFNINKYKSSKVIYNDLLKLCSLGSSENNDYEDITSFEEKIEFKNLYFGYEKDKNILKNINFTINKGEKIAIIGESGSGKTTILKLLLKYYSNFNGDILIDGVNVKEVSTENLYKLISMIHQNTFIFNDSIKNNICLYNNFDEKSLDTAINRSGLKEFINGVDINDDCVVGENAKNLSGGQKQRIAIARSFIKNTPIILLDESFSALDNITSFKIENDLLNMDEFTVISITHKLNEKILSKYNKIIVLKHGEIIEIGNFEELIKNKDYFYSLYTMKVN